MKKVCTLGACVANNTGADQIAHLRRLICAIVVCAWLYNRFSHEAGPIKCDNVKSKF